jgi:hypothetical protein
MPARSPSGLVDGAVTTGEFLEAWLAHIAGRVRPKTADGYRGLIRLYAVPALGATPLEELRPLDLQGLYTSLMAPDRALSAGTVVNLHLVLTHAFGQAERWGLIERTPATGAEPPRPRRPEPVIVDPATAERLLQATATSRFRLPVAIAIRSPAGRRGAPSVGVRGAAASSRGCRRARSPGPGRAR